jgi:hypothetical protein
MKKFLVWAILTFFPLQAFSGVASALHFYRGYKFSKILQLGKISSLTLKDLSYGTKAENIDDLLTLAMNENRIDFVQKFKYAQKFQELPEGDKLLFICLKHPNCDLEEFSSIASKSQLHRQVILGNPALGLSEVNKKVGKINEYIMSKYFESTGWERIEGEVGVNGIDGLFVKRDKYGNIKEVLFVESKYNKSKLGNTECGKQMSKAWLLCKVQDLQKKYPDSKEYHQIEKFIENDSYRARLWNMTVEDNKIQISLKKVHNKGERNVSLYELKGGEKTKVNFEENQIIDIENPLNPFQRKVIDWYKEALNNFTQLMLKKEGR